MNPQSASDLKAGSSGSLPADTIYPYSLSQQRLTGHERIPTFDGKPGSYQNWFYAVKDMMRLNGLKCLLDGTNRPDIMPDKLWSVIDDQLLGLLYTTVSSEVRQSLRDVEEYLGTAADFMAYIKRVYSPSSSVNKYTTFLGLCAVKQGSMSVTETCNEFKRLKALLTAQDVKLEDLYSLMLLNSFNSSFDITKQMLTSGENVPGIDTIMARMLSRETEINIKPAPEVVEVFPAEQLQHSYRSHQSIVSPVNCNPNSKMSNVRTKQWCTNCKRTGHNIDSCYWPGGGKEHSVDRPDWIKDAVQKSKRINHNPKPQVHQASDNNSYREFLMAANDNQFRDATSWIIDSGCTTTSTYDKRYFKSYEPYHGLITIGDGRTIEILGIGKVDLLSYVDGVKTRLELQNVYHVPKLHRNLISYGQLLEDGYNGVTAKDRRTWSILDDAQKVKLIANRLANNLFEVKAILDEIQLTSSSMLEHIRMGHLGQAPSHCETCDLTKITRPNRRKLSFHTPENVRDLLVSDVWGPYSTPSPKGSKFFVTFMDVKSRFSWVYFMSNKSEVLACLMDLNNSFKNQYGSGIKTFRSDNGGEYLSREFSDYLSKAGISRQLTAPYSPNQNGIAERLNRTLITIARGLKYQSGLPDNLWTECVSHANLLHNINRTKALQVTPYEAYHGTPPNTSNIYVFGCVVTIVKPVLECTTKLDTTGKRGVYIGCTNGVKGFRIWLPKERRVVNAIGANFNEEVTYKQVEWCGIENKFRANDQDLIFDTYISRISESLSDPSNQQSTVDDFSKNDAPPSTTVRVEPIECGTQSVDDEYEENSHDDEDDVKPDWQYGATPAGTDFKARMIPRISAVERQKVVAAKRAAKDSQKAVDRMMRLGELGLSEEIFSLEIPRSDTEALQNPLWKTAMIKEMQSFKHHDVFTVVPRQNGMKTIGGRWVYALKEAGDGSRIHKARYVARGFTQRPGLDYTLTYAPTTISASLRVILSIIGHDDLSCDQLDVSTAFLHGEMDSIVYMEQPKGFEDPNYPDHVVKVNKAIYGLKQAGHLWNKRIDEVLKKVGFKQLICDQTLYTRRKDDVVTYLLLYVDDILIASSSPSMINEAKDQLKAEFRIKDMGPISTFLGVSVTRNRRNQTVHLSQKMYLVNLLKKFELENIHPSSQPAMARRAILADPPTELDHDGRAKYQALVGSLLWASTTTRLDISAVVGMAAQKVAHPTRQDWIFVVNILRYLKSTLDVELVLGGSSDLVPEVYVDSSWASVQEVDSGMRSRHGMAMKLGQGTIMWWSRLQPIIALSTAEAEYIALSEAVKDASFIISLLSELGIIIIQPIVVHEDSNACIRMIANGAMTRHTRHIGIRQQYVIKAAVSDKLIRLVKIAGTENPADMFTKELPKIKIKEYSRTLGLMAPLRNDVGSSGSVGNENVNLHKSSATYGSDVKMAT